MPLTRVFGFCLSIVMVVTILSSVGSAQIKRPLRWLGEGFSDGYHRCAPGPNSDYYNPYTAHNSYLLHQTSSVPPTRFRTSGSSQNGVPYSVYAAPVTKKPISKAQSGQVHDNSFVPRQPTTQPDSENIWVERPNSNEHVIETNNDSAFLLKTDRRFGQRSVTPRFFQGKFSKSNR